ncbi:MAG: dephospho-CoA kinase [Vulcanibacillus sp.]
MLLGLTGNIASGKSTVACIFQKNGIPNVNADNIAREIVKPGEKAWELIIEYFGQAILLPDNNIDRKKLGDIVFRNSVKRKKLEEITHPFIIERMMVKVKILEKDFKYVLVEVPLLFETKIESIFDLIVLVYADKQTQLERLMLREGLSEKEALFRINSQIDVEVKKERADVIINNNLGLEKTEEQVLWLISRLKK